MSEKSESFRRPRLLLLAYACSPVRGSEGGVGWNRVVQAARYCDTWVICQDGPMGDEIRHHLATHGPLPGVTFEFIPKTALVLLLMRSQLSYYLGLNLWHRKARYVAKRLHDAVGFDLVHLVNLCTFREPGYLADLGIPFVWGSWGGTNNFPWRFLGVAGLRGAAIEATRTVVNRLQFRCSPRIRRAARRASVVVTNTLTQRDLARVHGVSSVLLPCNGINRVLSGSRPRRPDDGPFRILWSGELRAIKGLPLLLEALTQLPANLSYELRVLGDGPSRRAWQDLAQRLGVAASTTWMGWLPHAEALRQYAWADVFAFTSLRDVFPTVLLEALADGLPVVCLDHHGMTDIVTERCGVKIPVTTPRRVATDFAAAMLGLRSNRERWMALSCGAMERARDFLWPRLGEQMAEVYRRALSGGTRPAALVATCETWPCSAVN